MEELKNRKGAVLCCAITEDKDIENRNIKKKCKNMVEYYVVILYNIVVFR